MIKDVANARLVDVITLLPFTRAVPSALAEAAKMLASRVLLAYSVTSTTVSTAMERLRAGKQCVNASLAVKMPVRVQISMPVQVQRLLTYPKLLLTRVHSADACKLVQVWAAQFN